MQLPDDELKQLAEILDSGDLVPLRDRFDQPRQIRQQLSRYSSRIYFFPFGVHPNIGYPVQVFINGLNVWMGEEAELVRVGRKEPLTVVVLSRDLKDTEVVQATYQTVPTVGR